MAHWAEIDENNIVLRVTVGNNDEQDEGYQWLVDNLGGTWIKTSYNTRGGVHYGQDGKPDDGVPLHKNFAGIGHKFDGVGFYAEQPYPSWKFNTDTYLWDSPVPKPNDGKFYNWDEDNLTWVEIVIPEAIAEESTND